MSLLTIPNVFANGTGPSNIIDATQMNANFTAVQTAVNNIYPSQILPITTGQATFGATATGVGYKIVANDATATPLTVSAVTSQSVDIQDWTLTSGGTVAANVTATGQIRATVSGGVASGYLPPIYAAGGTSAATSHMVFTSFAGTGGTVTITLTNSAPFTNGADYGAVAFDVTAAAMIAGTNNSGSSISFAGTTNGHNYVVFAVGV